MIAAVYQRITAATDTLLAVLVDPDKHNEQSLAKLCQAVNNAKVDMLFVGGSLLLKDTFEFTVSYLKQHTQLPVVIFPGSSVQVSAKADALLFLSLVSGRNPEYLIGQQVAAAPAVKVAGIEVIPAAYLLIDGGKIPTTAYVTQTLPIPADKPDIAVATAMASEMMGMKLVYLEAGSGALNPVSAVTIRAVKKAVKIPVIVGGGIRNAIQLKAAKDAGADIIVVGNVLEDEGADALSGLLA